MRWVLLLALAACETTPYVTTSLDGSTACGSSTCGTGEICIEQAGGIDAADGHDTGTHTCFAPPKGCYVFDCHGLNCAPCLQQQCSLCSSGASDGCAFVDVAARTLYCPGQ